MRRSRLRRRVLVVAGGLVLFAGLAFVGWVVYLDHLVTREFTGRLWFVPARVYAAPVELYAGAPLSADDLEEELVRLHYRSGDPAAGPGSYRRHGGDFELSARRVRFVDEERAPVRLAIHAGSEAIGGLRAADGAELPLFRLDPLLVGSVFPVHGEDRIVLTPAEVTPLLKSLWSDRCRVPS